MFVLFAAALRNNFSNVLNSNLTFKINFKDVDDLIEHRLASVSYQHVYVWKNWRF